ncbi:MAG: hypothetical protein WC022_04155 [Parcubacteria group bacterium]
MEKIKKHIKLKQKRYKGYSFIEGVVATFIVTAGMLAVIQLMTASLTVLFNSRDQTMATFLAQEGVELVRNIRDNNWAAGVGTFDNLPSTSKKNCRIDVDAYNVLDAVCNSSIVKTLQKSANNGIHHHGSGTDTEFKRVIWLEYDNPQKNKASTVTVTSMVVWGGASLPTTEADCTSFKKCVFVRVILNKWGGTD